jgi:hypothetical protein
VATAAAGDVDSGWEWDSEAEPEGVEEDTGVESTESEFAARRLTDSRGATAATAADKRVRASSSSNWNKSDPRLTPVGSNGFTTDNSQRRRRNRNDSEQSR